MEISEAGAAWDDAQSVFCVGLCVTGEGGESWLCLAQAGQGAGVFGVPH